MGIDPNLSRSTSYVAEVLFSTIPPGHKIPSTDTATRAGSLALLLYALVAFTSGAVLPWLSTLGNKPFVEKYVSRTSKKGRAVRVLLAKMTPRNFWTLGLALYAIGILATFWVRTVAQAMVVVAFLGVPWSINCWVRAAYLFGFVSRLSLLLSQVPFALVMESIRELQPTPTATTFSSPAPTPALPPSTPTKRSYSPPAQPFRASLPPLDTSRDRTAASLTECSPLITASSRTRGSSNPSTLR